MTNPTMFPSVMCASSDKGNIFTDTSGSGNFTNATGFTSETSTPLASGGIPPKRVAFNAAFNAIGEHLFKTQKGFVFNFDSTQAYYNPCIVADNDGTTNRIYVCVADVAAGGTAPHLDTTGAHWKELSDYTEGYTTPIDLVKRSTAYSVGDIRYSRNQVSGYFLRCTTAGTTAASEPTWGTGNSVTDGSVVWKQLAMGGVDACTTAPTTTSSASVAHPAVVVENYVNGTEWYRVWSD